MTIYSVSSEFSSLIHLLLDDITVRITIPVVASEEADRVHIILSQPRKFRLILLSIFLLCGGN